MANISPANWNYNTAAHLLRRAGFGHNGSLVRGKSQASQVAQLANLTPDKAVDRVLSFGVSKSAGPGTLRSDDDSDFNKLTVWWINAMRNSGTPLREKMVLFLHGHFATGRSKVNTTLYHARQNALFRAYATGDFRDLVMQITIDPAMLWWLDGQLNEVGRPNENYARELQELFTLGVFDFNGHRNYAQSDVVQAARILTGWGVNEDYKKRKIAAYFSPGRHDTGAKTLFGPVTGETDAQNLANRFSVQSNDPMAPNYSAPQTEYQILVAKIFDHIDTEGRPTAARFMARKLWKFFAYDPAVDAGTSRADLGLIDALADEFKNTPDLKSKVNNYSLKSLLRAMFLREEFYADVTRTVKGPVEYVVGSVKMLHGKLDSSELTYIGDRLSAMGQTLFNPPNVKGWDGNQAWVTSQTLLKRFEFARDIANSDASRNSHLGWNLKGYVDPTATTRQAVVDRFLTLLGPMQIDPDTNDALVSWLGATDADLQLTDPNYLDTYVRGLVNLILTLPQYHVH